MRSRRRGPQGLGQLRLRAHQRLVDVVDAAPIHLFGNFHFVPQTALDPARLEARREDEGLELLRGSRPYEWCRFFNDIIGEAGLDYYYERGNCLPGL